MKKTIALLLIGLGCMVSNFGQNGTVTNQQNHVFWEEGRGSVQPNFPGGMNALYEYLNSHLQYPPSAREAEIEGRVIVGFVIGNDGRISNVQVLRSLDPACDEEAVRLIKNMPTWSPGKQGNKAVRVRMTLPVAFKLENINNNQYRSPEKNNISNTTTPSVCTSTTTIEPYFLLDYDKCFLVNLSVDTTMSLNQLPEYKNINTPRYTTARKVHCNFKVLYLWKNNYVVRAVVDSMAKIRLDNPVINRYQRRFFEAPLFDERNLNYDCGYDNHLNQAQQPNQLSDLDKIYNGSYLLKQNDSASVVYFYSVNVLRCPPEEPWQVTDKSIYYTCFKNTGIRYLYPVLTDEDLLKNYICESLFLREDVLIPQALPLAYSKYKPYRYTSHCCEGTDIGVNHVSRYGNNATYRVENKLAIYYPDSSDLNNPKNYYWYRQQLLYIPHVLFLPWSDNRQFIPLTRNNARIPYADPVCYFTYTINSINGKPFLDFINGYADDFKPTIDPVSEHPVYRAPVAKEPVMEKPRTNSDYDYDDTYNPALIPVQPNFRGGMNALYEYLAKNIHYPDSAKKAGIEGRVIVGFVVEKDGRISNVQILRSLHPACDEETVRLIKNMPAWTPGKKQNDKPVRVRMTLPVVFKLNDN